uniref:Matrix extracellular phosphoglycoprotein n=1 Tax=Ovis aries TaxID=9940 RepID=A0AC11CW30_SHEEP
MRIFYFELLLFSLTLAAPTLKPQAEKTKQDCVEEQRITYKGHHEKHGYYMFKHVSTSSGRKNQTDVKSPGASLLWTSVSQSLPDTHLMPWPKPCLASRPAIAPGRKKQRYRSSPFWQEKSRAST